MINNGEWFGRMAMLLGSLLTWSIIACIVYDAVVYSCFCNPQTVSDYIRDSWLRYPCGIGAGLMVAVHFFHPFC
jgi:hypothetical protein